MWCAVLGHVVVVVYGCVWLQLVVVFTLCVVVCGCSALWRVVFCVGTRWVPWVAPIFALLCCAVCRCVRVLGCVFRGVRFCVSRRGGFGVGFCRVVLCGVVARLMVFRCGLLLCGVSRCVVRGVRSCVLRWGRFVAGFCRVLFCGVVARPVAFRCITLPCGMLCCAVLLLLVPVGLVGLSVCGVVLRQGLCSLSVLSVVVWLLIDVLCWYVRCVSLLRPAVSCFVSLCSTVWSYGSCIVSWRVLCRGVLCCRVAFWCVGFDVDVWRRALSYGVVRCYLSVCRVV